MKYEVIQVSPTATVVSLFVIIYTTVCIQIYTKLKSKLKSIFV